MMKRTYIFACILVLVPLSVFATTFPDIQTSEFKSFIEFLAGKGIISGYQDGTFKPDNNITYAEALKIIYESAMEAGVEDVDVDYVPDLSTYVEQAEDDFPEIDFAGKDLALRGDLMYFSMVLSYATQAGSTIYFSYDQPFNDVPKSDERYDAISGAYYMGFINGYDDGTFKPDRYITRGEFSKIVYNVFFDEDSPVGQCYDEGGHYGEGSSTSGAVCYQYYSDGGDRCDDSRDCDGACLVTDTTATYGTCQEKEPIFGCFGERRYDAQADEIYVEGICLN